MAIPSVDNDMVSIRVELATYGYSFTVDVPSSPSSTVLSIKTAIFMTCPGSPQVDGQRIIWRGRVLGNEDKLVELWPPKESNNDNDNIPRIVHLSVHPSAWTGEPPASHKGKEKEKIITDKDLVDKLQAATDKLNTSTSTKSKSSMPAASAYMLSKHRQALATLAREPAKLPESDRNLAVQFVRAHGYIWPEILDAEFPQDDLEKGVRYQKEVIDGRPYLRLLDPMANPTAAQAHALNVLSYTIELLKLPPLAPTATRTESSSSFATSSTASSFPDANPDANGTPVQVPPHLNAVLQQMGLPPIRGPLPPANGPVQVQIINEGMPPLQGQAGDLNALLNGNPLLGQPAQPLPQAQVANIDFRPLLFPILMLSLRTLLLLYFVAPARKPFLIMMILAWVVWEIWVPAREVFGRIGRAMDGNGVQRAQPAAAGPAGGGAAGGLGGGNGQVPPRPVDIRDNRGAPAQGQVPNGAPAAAPGNHNLPANNPAAAPRAGAAGGNIIETFASLDIADGEAALSTFSPSATQTEVLPEPGIGRKALSFVVLLLSTVHPAVWNRRRGILRAREGRVRTEMNVLRETTNAGAPGIEGQTAGGEGQENNAAVLEATRRAAQRAEVLEKYMRRPMWVRRYMQRVVRAGERGDWGAGEEWVIEE